MRLFLFIHNYGSFVKLFIFLCVISCNSFTGWTQIIIALFGVVLMVAWSVLRSLSLIRIKKMPNVTILGASSQRFRRNLIWTCIAVGFAIMFFYIRSDLFHFLTFFGAIYWPLLLIVGISLVESLLPLSRWSCVVVGSTLITKEKKEFRLTPNMIVESLNRDAALVSDGDKEFRLWITKEDVKTLNTLLQQLSTKRRPNNYA